MDLPIITPEYMKLIEQGIALFFATILLLFMLSFLRDIWLSYKKKSEDTETKSVTNEVLENKLTTISGKLDSHIQEVSSFKDSVKDCVANLKGAIDKYGEVSTDTNYHMEKLCEYIKQISETQCVVSENVKNIMTTFIETLKRRNDSDDKKSS